VAIARHMGCDRKTIPRYLAGERQRVRRQESDPFNRIEKSVCRRLADDWRARTTVSSDEVKALVYPRSHPAFSRQQSDRGLRPRIGAYGRIGPARVLSCGLRSGDR